MNGLLALVMHAAAAAFSGGTVSDRDLSEMRGGFALPGGLDVAIAVQTDTKLDGALLLRTVYRLDQAPPRVEVTAADSANVEQSTTANSAHQVQLRGDAIDVRHVVGNAIGSVVTNTGSDRAIDTATVLSIDINGASAETLGSASLRVETLVLDATAAMMPR